MSWQCRHTNIPTPTTAHYHDDDHSDEVDEDDDDDCVFWKFFATIGIRNY